MTDRLKLKPIKVLAKGTLDDYDKKVLVAKVQELQSDAKNNEDFIKQQIAEYEKNNGGKRPSDNEIVQMGVDLATEKSTNLVVEKGGMFTADKQLYLSDVQTKKWGYSHYDVLNDSGYIRFYNPDGSYVDVHSVDVNKKIQDERGAGY